jgi:hypothetical protein
MTATFVAGHPKDSQDARCQAWLQPTRVHAGQWVEVAMQELLTMTMTWLAINFGLPVTYERPRVEIVSTEELAEVRYGSMAFDRLDDAAAVATAAVPSEIGHGIHAVYDDRRRTIFLPKGWSGATPADVSLLVHELTHHLQNVAGLTYDCPEAREAPAYRAQARWLELFGTTLADEFGLDAMTILLRTSCMR